MHTTLAQDDNRERASEGDFEVGVRNSKERAREKDREITRKRKKRSRGQEGGLYLREGCEQAWEMK